MSTDESGKFIYQDTYVIGGLRENPLHGYQELPIQTLEQSLANLVPLVENLDSYVHEAKRNCKRDTHLTLDESAAIYIYTMATPLHSFLNQKLRTADRDQIAPCFPFLKLFITALTKLPSLPNVIIVWRAVARDITTDFIKDPTPTWWAITSCSRDPKVVEPYLGDSGTLIAIETKYGKDVAAYSAITVEEEIILLPGTKICLNSQPSIRKEGLTVMSLKECTIIPEGTHIMLSFEADEVDLAIKISDYLRQRYIPVWCDSGKAQEQNIKRSLIEGVGNAILLLCLITPHYGTSISCKLVLQHAKKCKKSIIPFFVHSSNLRKPYKWLQSLIEDLSTDFSYHDSDCDLDSKLASLIDRIRREPPKFSFSSEVTNISEYLIKCQYMRDVRIQRLMNPAKSFLIEQSYVHLAIVTNKEQADKEIKLGKSAYKDTVSNFEEIYNTKVTINIEDIFNQCKGENRQAKVLGRAGIGKSTFCRYVAYQWAMGNLWPEYQLLALIPLRHLTIDRYPLLDMGKVYTLFDVFKREVLDDQLSSKDEKLIFQNFHEKNILWLLDGYDEVVQNIPIHLQLLLEKHLLKTPHHILTSRPYLNSLCYSIKYEIIGFTDENIKSYVVDFFEQMKDDIKDASIQGESLLQYLYSNRTIWGVAHIPVNLELICSVWNNEEWSSLSNHLTITKLYTKMAEWLFRRYLSNRNIDTRLLSVEKILNEQCIKELSCIEYLAFNAMKSNTIVIRPDLLRKVAEEYQISFNNCDILNVGILKSFDEIKLGCHIEIEKDYYFVHLTFQEYFAACYLVRLLRTPDKYKSAVHFIQMEKYNKRYVTMFTFISGLLGEDNTIHAKARFSDALLAEPLDLIGIRHLEIVLSCAEEMKNPSMMAVRDRILRIILQGLIDLNDFIKKIQIIHSIRLFSRYHTILIEPIPCPTLESDTLDPIYKKIVKQRSNRPTVRLLDILFFLIEHDDPYISHATGQALSSLTIEPVAIETIEKLLPALDHTKVHVRIVVCQVFGILGVRHIHSSLIDQLIKTLEDENEQVRMEACISLSCLGESMSTDEVIDKLLVVIDQGEMNSRIGACQALSGIGEKASTIKIIHKLLSLLSDRDSQVRIEACRALSWLNQGTISSDLWDYITSGLISDDNRMRMEVRTILLRLAKTKARERMIEKLITLLGDSCDDIKIEVCIVLGRLNGYKLPNATILILKELLEGENQQLSILACAILAKMDGQSVDKSFSKLLNAFDHDDAKIRIQAYKVVENLNNKPYHEEVVEKLRQALYNDNLSLRLAAFEALRKICPEAITMELIENLLPVLDLGDFDMKITICEILSTLDQLQVNDTCMNKIEAHLADRDERVRLAVCKVLTSVKNNVLLQKVLETLFSILMDDDEVLRTEACVILIKMNEEGARNQVMNKLLSILIDGSNEHRLIACRLLSWMGDNMVISAIIHLCKHQRFTDRRICVRYSDDDNSHYFRSNDGMKRCNSTISLALVHSSAIITQARKFWIYGEDEPIEIPIVDPYIVEVFRQLSLDQDVPVSHEASRIRDLNIQRKRFRCRCNIL